jgi:hypothetical protein
MLHLGSIDSRHHRLMLNLPIRTLAFRSQVLRTLQLYLAQPLLTVITLAPQTGDTSCTGLRNGSMKCSLPMIIHFSGPDILDRAIFRRIKRGESGRESRTLCKSCLVCGVKRASGHKMLFSRANLVTRGSWLLLAL